MGEECAGGKRSRLKRFGHVVLKNSLLSSLKSPKQASTVPPGLVFYFIYMSCMFTVGSVINDRWRSLFPGEGSFCLTGMNR